MTIREVVQKWSLIIKDFLDSRLRNLNTLKGTIGSSATGMTEEWCFSKLSDFYYGFEINGDVS